MDMEIPQRSLTKEEINRCYLRWQQLRNQHGDNANKIPEFVYFTRVLRQAAHQHQEQNQQAQAQAQIQSQSHISQPNSDNNANIQKSIGTGLVNEAIGTPVSNMSTPLTQGIANNFQQQVIVQQHMGRQSSQQGSPSSQVSSNQFNNASPRSVSIFNNDQSELLRAQINSLKCLVHKQPIPREILFVIQKSITNAPDFKQMLIALSETIKKKQHLQKPEETSQEQERKKYQQHEKELSNELHQSIQNSGPRTNIDSQTSGDISYDSSEFQEQLNNETSLPSNETRLNDKNEPANTVINQENQVNDQFQVDNDSKGMHLLKQMMPKEISIFKKENPEVINIVEVNNPQVMVDSFQLPEYSKEIDYNQLFTTKDNPKLFIEPGLLPSGIDIHSAMEAYQTLVALDIDTSVDDCLSKLLDDSLTSIEKDEAIYQYHALQLLPLQKAIRGHVLQFEWYQNTLLTNTHPNFLSKIRKISIHDALLTNDLYKKHEIQQYEKRKFERSAKLESIIDLSIAWFNQRMDRKTQRAKLCNRLITLHSNLEKEDQKRIEKNAKQRLQALKANDEEAYIKLLDQTKDTRITHLLKQTNTFLDSLTKAVKSQQKFTRDKIDSYPQVKENKDDENSADVKSDESDESEREKFDYYEVAHRIKEEIKKQPDMLVGGTLKEYQLKGLQWMVSLYNNHLNGILADEMGLGKTIQTISLLTYLYEVKHIHGPFLVIVPLSTLTNWSSEFDKWAPNLRKIAFKGSPNDRKSLQNIIKAGEFEVVLTTFEYIIKERLLLSKIKWVHMIIDEGHRMKNTQSKLSLTLNSYYHSDYRLILTGTPLQNNLPELWALLNFVLPKIFNSVKSFDEWFNTPFANTGGQDKIALSEEETLLVIRRLHKVLRPFLLRRLKKDVETELPDKVEKVLKCKMSALQQKLYEQMLKHRRLYVIDDSTSKKMVGLRGFNNQIMQLKKICNHPFVFEPVENQINPSHETNENIWRVTGKFELLERILPKFKATGHRVLIFFQMTQIMDIMEDFLRFCGIKYLRLDGQTKANDRTTLLNLFNAPNSEYFCFLLSTRAGGLGLNLQTADTVIIFDTDWNPHQDLQAQDRAHRIGQKNEVRILRLITENSVEEVILERAHQKLDIDGKVIQAGKFDNKSTSEEQEALLRSLLEADEEQKKKRGLGFEEDDQLDDNELNEILARNEDELVIFAKIDKERTRMNIEKGIVTRLMESSELPAFYHQDIDAQLEKEQTESRLAISRPRERKSTQYEDGLTEEQWLKQFEVSGDEIEETIDGKRRRGIRIGKSKKMKLEEDSEIDEGNKGDNAESQSSEILGKTSGKTVRPRGRPKGRRGRLTKNGRIYERLPESCSNSLEKRIEISLQAHKLYDYAINYLNEDGRRLSDIFLVKPLKKLYPDYYVLIKYPAAFENIFKHITANAYDSLLQTLEDFHLIFSNARVYNTEESIIYNDSIKLEEVIINRYRELSGDVSPINFDNFDSIYGTIPLINSNHATPLTD